MSRNSLHCLSESLEKKKKKKKKKRRNSSSVTITDRSPQVRNTKRQNERTDTSTARLYKSTGAN